MEIALVHQVPADAGTVAVRKKHVVGKDNGSPRLSVFFQTAVDVLKEVELLVAGGEGEVIPCGSLPAFFRPEGGIRQHHIIAVELLAEAGKGVPQRNPAGYAMQQFIHERKAACFGDKFASGERLVDFKFRRLRIQILESVGM